MTLTTPERHELERRVASRRGRADEARRARCILLVTEGTSWAAIRARLDCSDSYIARWTGRFTAERLAGLYAGIAGSPPRHSRRAWRRGSWRPRAGAPAGARRTGAPGGSASTWGSRT